MTNKPEPDNRRQIHVRSITCVAYERPDGLLDVEGTLVDTKPTGVTLPERGRISPEEPIHEMTVRLTIDRNLTIRDASAETAQSPHTICNAINERYRQLEGMRIGSGFVPIVKKLFKGTAGCSHLTELLPPIATTAFQALFGDPLRTGIDKLPFSHGGVPSPIDGCHALSSDGDIVKEYFPAFYRRKEMP